MPAAAGGVWTAAFSSACCSRLRAGGIRRYARTSDQPALLAESSPTTRRSCAGRAPAHPPPVRPTSPPPAATERASAPVLAASGRGTFAPGPRSGPTSIVSICPALRSSQGPATCAPHRQPTAAVLRVPPWLWFRHRDGRDGSVLLGARGRMTRKRRLSG